MKLVIKRKYRVINLTTEKAFDEAEMLQAQGWKIILVGFNQITMELESIG